MKSEEKIFVSLNHAQFSLFDNGKRGDVCKKEIKTLVQLLVVSKAGWCVVYFLKIGLQRNGPQKTIACGPPRFKSEEASCTFQLF